MEHAVPKSLLLSPEERGGMKAIVALKCMVSAKSHCLVI